MGKEYRYVKLDPTGNLTDLVLSKTDPADEPSITARLMQDCEQVAYLEKPRQGGRARIRLMGGEFCGNAAMAAACYLAREAVKPGEETTIPLEVSGAEGVLPCRVKALEDGYEGTVPMPRVISIRRETWEGLSLTAVRMEGILHMICEEPLASDAEAERLLREIAGQVPDEAVGLIQWKKEASAEADAGFVRGEMRPLVYVRGSGTTVWETGCGSGSAAVGALEAYRGNGTVRTAVRQPGGVICAEAAAQDGEIKNISITGRVKIGPEEKGSLPG